MGSGAFLILYFAAGIFGYVSRLNARPRFFYLSCSVLVRFQRNVFGGNFSLVGAPSVGASGAIFGTVGVLWVDLFAHWKLQYRPGRKVRLFGKFRKCVCISLTLFGV